VSRENTGGRRITGSGTGAMRQMTLGAAVLVVIQMALAMVVNLHVRVPTDHPGSHPANYFSGSFHSVLWALGQGDVALVIHAWLGLALVALTLVVAVHAASLGPRSVSVRCLLGSLLAVGAGFNGASFLDFAGQSVSSLIMALLGLADLCCYPLGLYLLPAQSPRRTELTQAVGHQQGSGPAAA